MKIKISYGEYDNCFLNFHKYKNGQNALIITNDLGEVVMTVSKCLPTYIIESNQIFVKDYSENEGILDCLANLGIIEKTNVIIPTGYTHLHLCNLLVNPEIYKQEE